MGNGRAWWNSMPGMSADSTAQLMLVKSEDDGKTWSQPINITPQVKDPSWYFLLQGPGRGITMKDGTLVFPIQFIDSTRIPNAGIMYSKDRGTTWHLHNLARTNTTEAQVAEIEPGVLMLNMRDNRAAPWPPPAIWARPGMNIRPAAVPCRNRFVWQASSTWTLKTTSRGKTC